MKNFSRPRLLLIGIMVVSPIVLAVGSIDALWSANISETAEVNAVSTTSSPASSPNPVNSCQHKGMVYRDGQSFKDECNYCGCSKGQVVCTQMACRVSPTPHPTCVPRPACLDAQPACMLAEPREGWCRNISPLPSVTPPPGMRCEYKGRIYREGEGFRDECNHCGCSQGRVVCTQMACKSSPLPTPNVCNHKGRTFKDGESFRDECNACGCWNGQVRCTERACPDRSSPLPPPKSCTHKGKTYKDGESFRDECNKCTCFNGQAACTKMACGMSPTPKPTCAPRPACLDVPEGQAQCAIAEPREGWCPKTSPKPSVTPSGKTCEHKGKIYKDGEGFKDECNQCGCSNGQVACTLMACHSSPTPTATAIPPLPGDPTVNDCSLLNAKAPVRPGVGAPFNPFSPDKRLLMRSECTAEGFKAKIETGGQQDKSVAAYRFGFKWNGKTWEKFEFVSTATGGNEPAAASEFLPQPLVSKDTLAYAGDTTYWLAYTCAYKNKLWKCGCADDTCGRSHWNMQGAVRQPIPVE